MCSVTCSNVIGVSPYAVTGAVRPAGTQRDSAPSHGGIFRPASAKLWPATACAEVEIHPLSGGGSDLCNPRLRDVDHIEINHGVVFEKQDADASQARLRH